MLNHIEQKHKLDIEHPAVEPAQPVFEKPMPEPSVVKSQGLDISSPPIRISQHGKPPEAEEQFTRASYSEDLSGLVQAIFGLKNVMAEINNTLKGIQKKQDGIHKELFEFRQIFSEEKKKKKIRRFFS